jgi:hypothetical protein
VAPGLLKHLPNDQVQRVFLNEVNTVPELHLSEGGDPIGNMWYLDNGVSNHMTGDRHKLKELDHAITGKVCFGDDSIVEIQGRGTILFQGKFGDQWFLSDVYYIPKLRSNLISLGQLTEIDLRVELDDDMLEVSEKNPSRLIMQVQRSLNRMYKIELNPVDPSYLMANIGDEAWLWHGRLGHINFRSLKQLAKKEMALGCL